MFSIETEFLTFEGWKNPRDITSEQSIACLQDDSLSWLNPTELEMKLHEFPIEMYECEIGRTGKFCITDDVTLSFTRKERKKVSKFDRSFDEVVDKLGKVDFIPGHIASTFDGLSPVAPDDSLYYLAEKFFLLLPKMHSVSEDGSFIFVSSKFHSKDQIKDMLLSLSIPIDLVYSVKGDTHVRCRLGSYEELFLSSLYYSKAISKGVMELNDYNHNFAKSGGRGISTKRFYCKRLADIAQTVMSFNGFSTKMYNDEGTSSINKNWVLKLIRGETGISFRNKVIILSKKVSGVRFNRRNILSRYDGRVAII